MNKYEFLELVAGVLAESDQFADYEMSGSVNKTTGLNELEVDMGYKRFIISVAEVPND